jgi:hypothetical protein
MESIQTAEFSGDSLERACSPNRLTAADLSPMNRCAISTLFGLNIVTKNGQD